MPILSEDEEPGETTSIIFTNQIQSTQNLRFIPNMSSGNASFHLPRRLHIRRRSASERTSRERLLAAKERSYYLSQMPTMGCTGLTISLFLLAAVCAAHLLRRSTFDLKFKIEKSFSVSNIYQSFHHGSLPSYVQPHQFTSQQRDINRKVSQMVNDRFHRLSECLKENIPSKITSASLTDWNEFGWFGRRQQLQLNVLLIERRRRTVQRQRSPTPIPSSTSSLRFVLRQRNTSSAPPDSLRSLAALSTSTQPSTSDNFETNFNRSNEPTLMDYDAIDSYWRWDIDQEKRRAALISQQIPNDFNYSELQHQQLQNDYSDNYSRYSVPTDLLFERDIHLLTEKSLLPDEQTNFLEDNLNANEADFLANFSRTLSFDGIVENENTKWNDLLQLPTSSLFTSSEQDGKVSFVSSSSGFQNSPTGDAELYNIPVSSPCFETKIGKKFNQREDFNLNEREFECSSSSSHGSFSPLSDMRQPILFNDVSLARCSSSMASIEDGNDNEEKNLEKEHSSVHHYFIQNNTLLTKSKKEEEEFKENNNKKKEFEENQEVETEMLLSAIFPQFFSPLSINGNETSQQQQQLSNSSSSNGGIVNKTEIEAVLNDLAAAEAILMNSTQTLFQNELLLQQQSTTSLPLSPIFDHFNQTLNMNGSSPSSSLPFDTNGNSFNLFGGPLNICCDNQNNSCSPTTSLSSFGLPINDFNNFGASSEKEFLTEGLNEIFNNPLSFRFEQKLVPKNSESFLHRKNPTIIKNIEGTIKEKSKRGRRSKDDSLVNKYDLPYSAEHLTAMSYRDYSSLMQNVNLNSEQKALIKKIRRRGRNKLAARKCRERRLFNEKIDGKLNFSESIEDDEEWDEDVEVVDINDNLIINQNNKYISAQQQQQLEKESNSVEISRFPTTSLYSSNIFVQNNINSPSSRQYSHKQQNSSNQFAIRVEI